MPSTEKETKGKNNGLDCEPPEVVYRQVEAALTVLTGKWKILVLWKLWESKRRFGELRKDLPGITQHMLTATLKELESEGLVIRQAFAEIPPRVEYSLSEHARSLEPSLLSLKEWGKEHLRYLDERRT